MTETTQNVTEVRAVPLGDLAYRRIKEDILRCALAPGEEFTEAQISDRYNLGKAPVRHALARLSHEGLTEVQPRKGYRVAPVSLAAVRDVFQLRLILECEAARLAAGRLSGEQLLRMKAVCRLVYEPGNRESESAFLAANRAFHLTIAEASGNQRLCQWIAQLLDDTERMLHLGLAREEKGGEFQREHLELLQVLMVNDADKAEALVREQINGGWRMVLDSILSRPDISSNAPGEDMPLAPSRALPHS